METPRRNGGFRLFTYVTERMEHDRLLTMVITAMITLAAVASVVAGIAIWPVLFSFDRPASILAGLFSSAKTAGIVMLAVSAVVSIVMMLFRRTAFRLIPALFTNLLINTTVAFVFTIMHVEIIQRLQMSGTMGSVLWFFASLLFSYALAIVPSILVAGLVRLIHAILNAILPE